MIFADNRKSTDICVSNNGTVLDICLSHQRIFFVACGATMDDGIRAQKRERRDKATMVDEKAQVFGEVLDLRAAKIRQRDRFDFAFTTDGVSARLQCSSANRGRKGAPLTSLPSRGIHAIDELKRGIDAQSASLADDP